MFNVFLQTQAVYVVHGGWLYGFSTVLSGTYDAAALTDSLFNSQNLLVPDFTHRVYKYVTKYI